MLELLALIACYFIFHSDREKRIGFIFATLLLFAVIKLIGELFYQ